MTRRNPKQKKSVTIYLSKDHASARYIWHKSLDGSGKRSDFVRCAVLVALGIGDLDDENKIDAYARDMGLVPDTELGGRK